MPSRSSRVDSLVPVAFPQPEVAVSNPVSEQIPSTSGVSVPSPGGRSGRQGVPAAPMAPGGQQLMPLIQASVSPATWQAHGAVGPTVWLVGHSYIFWAAQRAECRPGGRSLGFSDVRVSWRGIRGLRWSQLLSQVVEIGTQAVGPVVLVVHAGGNDIGSVPLLELLTLMRADLERFPSFFREVILVWSEIVPRAVWQSGRDGEAIEKCRRTVNARMSRFVRSRGGVVVRHRQLEGDNRSLMRPDGVHLSDIGLDIFLSGIQDGIEQAMFLLGGGRSPV
ncbi:uncharacterized protein LOC122923581 isoform X2 [Bufo gargarizans]|uniref:uncharacterized protein LOC122923581 isoform X2 n=1 Tax=Bufo gargarizans TaxID=30331 RepID=UPI001CF58E90|nr:uncharacterized protein LOC122923581 isoform X2 [Bufo gargarizans]